MSMSEDIVWVVSNEEVISLAETVESFLRFLSVSWATQSNYIFLFPALAFQSAVKSSTSTLVSWGLSDLVKRRIGGT